jgi:hypothetical protein
MTMKITGTRWWGSMQTFVWLGPPLTTPAEQDKKASWRQSSLQTSLRSS